LPITLFQFVSIYVTVIQLDIFIFTYFRFYQLLYQFWCHFPTMSHFLIFLSRLCHFYIFKVSQKRKLRFLTLLDFLCLHIHITNFFLYYILHRRYPMSHMVHRFLGIFLRRTLDAATALGVIHDYGLSKFLAL